MATRWTQTDVDRVQAQINRPLKMMPRALVPNAAKPNKYRNVKVVDAKGAVHDSGKEFRRWQVLELRERAGEIRSLRRQVPYALVDNGFLICTYIADFVYEEGAATIVEDVKSPITRTKPEYRIKLKLMQSKHGLQIREV